MERFFLDSGTVAVDLCDDCCDWIRSSSSDQNTMKARQPELRAILQFDSGRWKLRLERVSASSDNQTNDEQTTLTTKANLGYESPRLPRARQESS